MRHIFKALAKNASDALKNMMDRVNPEKVYLDCWGDNNRAVRLFAVGTISTNKWDIHLVKRGSNIITPMDRIKTARPTAEMIQLMDGAIPLLIIGGEKKALSHYDNWRQRNVRRLAKQGIKPAPAPVS